MASLTVVLAAGNTKGTTILRGDANGDGRVDVGDAVAMERQWLGLDFVKSWSDANWDGTFNVGDVVYLERVLLGVSPQIVDSEVVQ